MKATIYGDKMADTYDELYPPPSSTQIDFLQSESKEGPVLELGIGTGRVAIPLSQKGLEVHGIEISPRMIEKLKAKPGADKISVTLGSFVDIKTPPKFSLIFATFNTFFGFVTREDQLKAFKSISNALIPGGKFIMEAIIPNVASFNNGQSLSVKSVSQDEVVLRASKLDSTTQTLIEQKIKITEAGIKLIPTELRYAFPSELDLMAESADLSLSDRFGWWDKREFKKGASSYISVYLKSK